MSNRFTINHSMSNETAFTDPNAHHTSIITDIMLHL